MRICRLMQLPWLVLLALVLASCPNAHTPKRTAHEAVPSPQSARPGKDAASPTKPKRSGIDAAVSPKPKRSGNEALPPLPAAEREIGMLPPEPSTGAESKDASVLPADAREHRLTLAAAGDVLIHRTLYEDARTANGQGYDFRPMFAAVLPWLREADIAFVNQESIVGGQSLGLSDYPVFNSPHEVAEALRDAGVDIVSMANNHTLDRGEAAIRAAVRQWSKLGVQYVGANVSEEDRKRLRILEQNGIKLAFLAYTYGTNGIPTPEEKPYLVQRIDRAAIAADIATARQQADAVVVSLHYGKEYERTPNAEQISLAQHCAVSGADIILGHHPHVLQPPAWIDNGRGGRTLAVYSLGNLLAAQKSREPYNRIGGIMQVTIRKTVLNDGNAQLQMENVRFLPTYIRFANWRGYRIVPLSQISGQDVAAPDRVRSLIRDHLLSRMPELQLSL